MPKISIVIDVCLMFAKPWPIVFQFCSAVAVQYMFAFACAYDMHMNISPSWGAFIIFLICPLLPSLSCGATLGTRAGIGPLGPL